MSSWLYEGTCTLIVFNQQRGETPLHDAVMRGNAEVVTALVKAGSKVNEKDQVIIFCQLCILYACINTMNYTMTMTTVQLNKH